MQNESQRVKALRGYEIIDTPAEPEFDRITKLASLLCNVPISHISIIDEDTVWLKSKIGLAMDKVRRGDSFCTHAIKEQGLLEINDALEDSRVRENPSVLNDPGIRFYAGYPLVDPMGHTLGTLCVIDQKPKKLSDEEKKGLKLLAEEVVALIVERRQRDELKNFQKIFEFSNDLLFIGGTDGFFKKVNPAFTKILGWSREHILTTSSFEFVHPDDIENTERELKKLSEGGETVNFLQRFKASNGEYRTIQWTSSPEASTGNIFGIGRDITDKIELDRQLALSEEKLRLFFEHSQGLMCTHDLEGNFITVNSAGAGILGYSREEIMGMSLYDIVPQPRHPFLDAYLVEIKETGHVKGQMLTHHKNGAFLIWMYNNVLEKDSNGDVYVIGNAIDITERHKLEKDLERTKEMLEQTSNVARVGGWEFDLRTQQINWTAVTKEIHGVSADFSPDLATALDFYKEGIDREKMKQLVERAIKECAGWDEEMQIVTAKGKQLWVRAKGNVEFEDGKCKRIYGTFQDINDYKLAELALQQSLVKQGELNHELVAQIKRVEEQDQTIQKIQEFKFLADSIPQIIWTARPDGSRDYYNQYWYNYTGLTPEQTLNGGWDAMLHPDDLPRYLKIWTESYSTGKPFEMECRFKRGSDGVYKWHLGRAVPMKNETGEIVKWFGSSTDIDEYKRALDLETRIGQYEDFNRIVAHNLRGPAGSIGMIIEMIEETSSMEEKEELLDMLKESSVTLNETLNELMKVLEVRNNKDIPFDDCDLTDLVYGMNGMLKGQIISKNAKIITDFKTPVMRFPKMYLESIFYNMISNALKYSKPGVPPVIEIASEKVHGNTVVTFSDNGLGIDLHRHGKNMFKLNKVFHSGFDSKGVGLFMTKTQIETFGGHISVESEPNVGSKFTVEFSN